MPNLSAVDPNINCVDSSEEQNVGGLQLRKQPSTEQMSIGKLIITWLLDKRLPPHQGQTIKHHHQQQEDSSPFFQQCFDANVDLQQKQIKELLVQSNPQCLELYVYAKSDKTSGVAMAEVWQLKLGQDYSFVHRRGSFRDQEILKQKVTIQDDYFDSDSGATGKTKQELLDDEKIGQFQRDFSNLLESLPMSNLISNEFKCFVTWQMVIPRQWESSMIPLTNQIEASLSSSDKVSVQVLHIDQVDIENIINKDVRDQQMHPNMRSQNLSDPKQNQQQKVPPFMKLQAAENPQKHLKQSNNPFLNLGAGIGSSTSGGAPISARNRVYSDNVMMENRYGSLRQAVFKKSTENSTDKELKSSLSKLSDLQENAFVDVTKSSFSPTSSQNSKDLRGGIKPQQQIQTSTQNQSQSILSSAFNFVKTGIQSARMSIGATNQQSNQQQTSQNAVKALQGQNQSTINTTQPLGQLYMGTTVRQRTYSYNLDKNRGLQNNLPFRKQQQQNVQFVDKTVSSEDRVNTESIQSDKQIVHKDQQNANFIKPSINTEKNFRLFLQNDDGDEQDYNLGNTSPIKSLRSQEQSDDSSSASSNPGLQSNEKQMMTKYYGFLKSKKKLEFTENQTNNQTYQLNDENNQSVSGSQFIVCEQKAVNDFVAKINMYQQRIHQKNKIKSKQTNQNSNARDILLQERLNENFLRILKMKKVIATHLQA